MSDAEPTIPKQQIAAVVHEHTRLLYRVAFGIVREHAAAEDACQEAVVKLLRDPDQVRDWRNVRSWLVRTVSNNALLHLRRGKSEAQTLRRLRPSVELDPIVPDPLLRQKMLAALAGLDDEVREVVVLRVMEGLSGVEVQRLLSLSAAEVSRRLHAGLNRLRLLLREPLRQENGR